MTINNFLASEELKISENYVCISKRYFIVIMSIVFHMTKLIAKKYKVNVGTVLSSFSNQAISGSWQLSKSEIDQLIEQLVQ